MWNVGRGMWNKRCRHVARSPVKQGSVHNEIPVHKLICVTGIPFEPFRLFLFSDPIGCFSSERSEQVVKTQCPLCLCERIKKLSNPTERSLRPPRRRER
jgi:hypothetical protein